VRLTGEGFGTGIDEIDDRRVDVDTDHVVALVGELDGQGEADLSESHYGNAHNNLCSSGLEGWSSETASTLGQRRSRP
jgi:hypothetical protein